MKAAEARENTNTVNTGIFKDEELYEANWTYEKAICDWENEGGGLGIPGSSMSA
jgi:hypothetical protein